MSLRVPREPAGKFLPLLAISVRFRGSSRNLRPLPFWWSSPETWRMAAASESLKKRVGRLLKAARTGKGWTQAKLAEASGTSYDMVVKIETGRSGASFATIEKLADALQIDPGELFLVTAYPGSRNTNLHDLTAQLATLSAAQLEWLTGIVEASLKPVK